MGTMVLLDYIEGMFWLGLVLSCLCVLCVCVCVCVWCLFAVLFGGLRSVLCLSAVFLFYGPHSMFVWPRSVCVRNWWAHMLVLGFTKVGCTISSHEWDYIGYHLLFRKHLVLDFGSTALWASWDGLAGLYLRLVATFKSRDWPRNDGFPYREPDPFKEGHFNFQLDGGRWCVREQKHGARVVLVWSSSVCVRVCGGPRGRAVAGVRLAGALAHAFWFACVCVCVRVWVCRRQAFSSCHVSKRMMCCGIVQKCLCVIACKCVCG